MRYLMTLLITCNGKQSISTFLYSSKDDVIETYIKTLDGSPGCKGAILMIEPVGLCDDIDIKKLDTLLNIQDKGTIDITSQPIISNSV